MISGISGTNNYDYLRQTWQAQSGGLSADQIFKKIDTNGDGSISKDELTTYRSALEAQIKSSVLGSQSDSTTSFLALLQSAGLAAGANGSIEAAASSPSTSQSGSLSADQLFSKIDTNGDGSISKDEFQKAGAALHHHRHHSGHKVNSQTDPTSPLNQLFSKIDTNGDGSVSQDELITFLTNLGGTAGSQAVSSSSSASGGQNSAAALAQYLQLEQLGWNTTNRSSPGVTG